MLGREREYRFRVDRKIASGTEKIDDHLQTIGDHRRARTRQSLCAKNVPGKLSEPTARRRQNPQFADQLSKVDAAPSCPWILRARRHEIGIVVENFEAHLVIGKRTDPSQDHQADIALVPLTLEETAVS